MAVSGSRLAGAKGSPDTSDAVRYADNRGEYRQMLPIKQWGLVGIELRKQFFRPRTYIVLAATAILPPLIAAALAVSGSARPERVQAMLITPSSSGLSLWYIVLSSTEKFFIPLAVALFAGEAIAGEASWGSLRYLCAGTYSRTQILISKMTVAAILCIATIAILSASSLATGLAAFGTAPLPVTVAKTVSLASAVGQLGGTARVATIYSVPTAIWKLLLSTLYGGTLEITIFTFAVLASVIWDRPIVAIGAGIGLAVVSWNLQTDAIPGLDFFAKYTPTHGIGLWQWMFVSPALYAGMAGFIIKQIIYGGIFLAAAFWWFIRKDIYS